MAETPREDVHKKENAEKEIIRIDGLLNISLITVDAMLCETDGTKDDMAFDMSYCVTEIKSPVTDIKIVIKGIAEIKI